MTQENTNTVKVVIVLKGDRGTIGIQSPDCDPVFATMEGDLEAALARIPGMLAEARQRWQASPRYPKANLPTPPPLPAPVRTAPGTRTPAARAEPQGRFPV